LGAKLKRPSEILPPSSSHATGQTEFFNVLPGRKLKRFLMDKNSLHRTKLEELSFNAFYFSFSYADLPHVRLVNAARCRHSMPNQGIAMFDQFNPHSGVKYFVFLLFWG
jgi:hypothetical protein